LKVAEEVEEWTVDKVEIASSKLTLQRHQFANVSAIELTRN